MVCNHSIVGPIVDNHRKPLLPLLPMVARPNNHRKTIDLNGWPKPFHSMVMVPWFGLVWFELRDMDQQFLTVCLRPIGITMIKIPTESTTERKIQRNGTEHTKALTKKRERVN